ncbi:MAG: aminomethyl-transferring glycine dehydrogenase subunit GcvPA [Spirochaetia bacterium]|nr:aminomethyl-transferring glycine dehydrogenase subunit GcvPA [Spirochaetia bacterium]
MYTYVPHSLDQVQHMLDAIGVKKVSDLFSHIDGIFLSSNEDSSKGMSEEELRRYFEKIANKNKRGLSFLGFGIYSHIIPSAVNALASLPQFVTSYTPYQAETSQGYLQAIFEFQSYITTLTGLDVANASLYDGHSAAVEAINLMCHTQKKRKKVLISSTLHPFTIIVITTWAVLQDIELIYVGMCRGSVDVDRVKELMSEEVMGLLVQSPNRYGFIEDYSEVASIVHSHKGLFAISSDPLSVALQKNARQWGADIAIGDTQTLGLPLAFGGATCGYMSVDSPLMRKIPGRIVGQTVDMEGKRAFCLTLQAREQHITRYRSTSNICSNHAHFALTSTIYLALVGDAGFKEVAKQSYDKAHYLHSELQKVEHVVVSGTIAFFCEFPLVFESVKVMESVIKYFLSKGVYIGVPLYKFTHSLEDSATLLVAVTEKHTKEEIDLFVTLLKEALQ